MQAIGRPCAHTQIFEMLADRLLVAQIVIMLNEAVEQRLITCAPDLLHFDGRSSLSAAVIGVVSISIGAGRSRSTSGLRVMKRTAGSSISPARCSISNRPRQTISRRAPLACFHCHASHTFADSFLRLMPGCSAMNRRRNVMSSGVMTRPRYFHSTGICGQFARVKNGTQAFCCFAYAVTRRHSGGASVSGLPAASSSCA